jgi:UDP-glucuronate 4-epimerase
MPSDTRILVTGAAGFIGYHLSGRLLEDGFEVTGLDNLNDYYDVGLKAERLRRLEAREGFRFIRADISDRKALADVFDGGGFDYVVNLAAQAGVRCSLKNPFAFVQSNVSGFLNLVEECRGGGVRHLVFASSSSVYGANTKMPYSVGQNVDHPVSLYAATKKAGELIAHSYASLYGLPVTGLRFFTVYGPWGRPDMAYFLFTKAILEGKPIDVYNRGDMRRDFTYIDDAVEAVARVLENPPVPDPAWDGERPDPARSYAPYRLYNIGNNRPVELGRFIQVLEECIGRRAEKNLLPMQKGDVLATYADVEDLEKDVGFRPSVPIEEGLSRFVKWYKKYYRVQGKGGFPAVA